MMIKLIYYQIEVKNKIKKRQNETNMMKQKHKNNVYENIIAAMYLHGVHLL